MPAATPQSFQLKMSFIFFFNQFSTGRTVFEVGGRLVLFDNCWSICLKMTPGIQRIKLISTQEGTFYQSIAFNNGRMCPCKERIHSTPRDIKQTLGNTSSRCDGEKQMSDRCALCLYVWFHFIHIRKFRLVHQTILLCLLSRYVFLFGYFDYKKPWGPV